MIKIALFKLETHDSLGIRVTKHKDHAFHLGANMATVLEQYGMKFVHPRIPYGRGPVGANPLQKYVEVFFMQGWRFCSIYHTISRVHLQLAATSLQSPVE